MSMCFFVLQIMTLDNEIDPKYGFSAQQYFERVCRERNTSRCMLINLGSSDCASIVNKYAGNVLELAGGFEVVSHVIDVITGKKTASQQLPCKVSVSSLVYGVAWLGVSLCQRFMLQGEQQVLPVRYT